MERSPSRWLLLGLVPLLGLAAYLLLRPAPPRPGVPQGPGAGVADSPREPSIPPPLIPPSPPTTAYPAVSLTPTPLSEAEQRCGTSCFCGVAADDPCGPKRVCGKGACGDDLGKQGWRVRLGGVKLEGSSEPDGETRVCVKVHGKREEACAALKETRKPTCAGGARLAATTEQLLESGLDIDIYDGQGQLLASARQAAYKFMTVREMCNGMRFGPGKFTGQKRVELIWFYLDDAGG